MSPVRVLVFSDIHRDLVAARDLVRRSTEVDLVLGAGDYAVKREGLADVIRVLADIRTPTVLVPGNGESDRELEEGCRGWGAARVLHGAETRIAGVEIFGIGGAIPETPFGSWSFDLSEEDAERMLDRAGTPRILVSHSPPSGHADRSRDGRSLGSVAVRRAAERLQPDWVFCGHIHDSWGTRSSLGRTQILNVGPTGEVVVLE